MRCSNQPSAPRLASPRACDKRNRVDPQQRWQRGPPTGVSPPKTNNAVTWYIHVSALRVSNH